jgi:hypothetical protein
MNGSFVRIVAVDPPRSESLLIAQMQLQIPIYHHLVPYSGDPMVTKELFAIGDHVHKR